MMNRESFSLIIKEDLDFLKKNIPNNLQGHPSLKHIESILKHSTELIYGEEHREWPMGLCEDCKHKLVCYYAIDNPYEYVRNCDDDGGLHYEQEKPNNN